MSVWPPVINSELTLWKNMMEVWKSIEKVLESCAGPRQLYRTANNIVKDGKVMVEVGAPETSFQFYGTYSGVCNARYLYDVITKRVPEAELAPMPPPPRTPVSGRGGVSQDACRGGSYRDETCKERRGNDAITGGKRRAVF